jgi:hypothetical protein
MTIGTADGSGGYIELEGEVPARGHFVLVDGGDIAFDLPSNADHYQAEKTLNYLLPHGQMPHEQKILLQRTENPGDWTDPVTVMEFTCPDTEASEKDSDTLATTQSIQIDDPRPCWYRGSDQTEPWGTDAWVVDEEKTAVWNSTDSYWEWPSTTTTHLGWFNKNWRNDTSGNDPIGSGDNYYRLNVDGTGTLNADPTNDDNLLHSFPPVVQEDAPYTGVSDHNTRIMNNEIFPSPGAISFVHAGIPWGTVSLTNPTNASDIGASDIVYLKNFTDYLVGPVSPYENGVDDDGDGYVDEFQLIDEGDESDNSDGINNDDDFQDDNGHQTNWSTNDRFGPEIRQRGKVNVNTAPAEVLKAVLKQDLFGTDGFNITAYDADFVADAIVAERVNAPYSSVDDLFERVPEIFGYNTDTLTDELGGIPNSARRQALARFMYNLVTVRTDVWGLVGKVRLYDDTVYDVGDPEYNNDQCDDGEEITSKTFYMVIDRSFDPPRIVLRKSGD